MILAIDFDDTIIKGDNALVDGAKKQINQLKNDGHFIIIWTSRTGESLDEAINILSENEINYDAINENKPGIKNDPRKVIADIYIDDKNLGGLPDWNKIYDVIAGKKTLKSFSDMENKKYTIGTIREFDRAKAEETRTVEFVISDETRDRHGTIIPVDAWTLKNFNQNGIVGYQHEIYGDFFGGSNPDQVLGRGEAFIEDGKLIGRVTFEPEEINPLAEKIFKKVLHGTLKATSVGFHELQQGSWGEKEEARDGSNPTYYFKSVELLEFSIVNIPSNPAALRRKLERDNELETLRAENELIKTRNTALKNENENLQTEIEKLNVQTETLRQNLRYSRMKRPQ